MTIGPRVFVALVFFVLGGSFLATSGVLFYEFQNLDWFALAAFYSHLFVFFPTFGLVALAAFYLPASVFTDLYWHHVPYGKLRFIAGFIIVSVVSYLVASLLLAGEERSLWEVKPAVLENDQGAPANCNAREGEVCNRLPVLVALQNVRTVSQSRTGLSAFVRNCDPDPFVERPNEAGQRRFCFMTGTLPPKPGELTTAEDCCRSQKSFVQWMSDQHAVPDQQSLTGKVHNALLPFKVFFLVVLLIVGIMLAVRIKALDTHYGKYGKAIERGVLIGAFAMLFWPVMNHAFLQSAAVLYGTGGGSTFRFLGPGFSLAFGAWGLLLLLFFYRRFQKSLENVGKIAGVVFSGVAIIKYELIVDYFVRFAGSGASIVTLSILAFIGAIALVHLFASIGDDSAEFAGQMSEYAFGSDVEPATAAASTASATPDATAPGASEAEARRRSEPPG